MKARFNKWLLSAILFGISIGVFGRPDCSLIGCWRGEEQGTVAYQDFNREQVLVLTYENDVCRILNYSPYSVQHDTITIFSPARDDSVRVLARFIDCDSLHLINFQSDGSHGKVLPMKRVQGHPCDHPDDFVAQPPFFSRKSVRQVCSILFLVIYLPVLIWWFTLYFRRRERQHVWWWLVLICLLFSPFAGLILFLLVFHLSIAVLHSLRDLRFINSLGRVIFYSFYAGAIILFEYVLRFGFDQTYIYSYFTFVPLMVNVIGFTLVIDVMRQADALGFTNFKHNFLIGLLLLFGPQLYVFYHREVVFAFIRQSIIAHF